MAKMINLNKFKINIYVDGANLNDFIKFKKNKLIKGFTTNPSLMRKAGIKNYKSFSLKVLNIIKKKPVSFEVFTDNTKQIEDQSREISSWADNVYVKIPIMNTKKKLNSNLIGKLNKEGIKINVTAVFTANQTKSLLKKIGKKTNLILSVFAGRIADAGADPVKEIKKHIKICKQFKNVKILWASVRESYNIIEAEKSKCDIITVPPSILSKLKLFNKNLSEYSKETVQTFYDDAKKSGYSLK